MVNCVADGVPTYVVECEKTKKRQVLHRARLLLWQAEFDGKPLRVNRPSDRFESTWNGSEDPTLGRWKGVRSAALFGLWLEYDPTSSRARIFRPEGGQFSPRGAYGNAPQWDGLQDP